MKDGASYKDRDVMYLEDMCEMKEELQAMWNRLDKLRRAEVMEEEEELEVDEALDHINKAMLNLWNYEV
jgi:ribosome assembly protein YihI (activator of Der GTPase)